MLLYLFALEFTLKQTRRAYQMQAAIAAQLNFFQCHQFAAKGKVQFFRMSISYVWLTWSVEMEE